MDPAESASYTSVTRLRVAAEELDLFDGERRPAGRHDILEPRLMQRDEVHVPFHQQTRFLVADGFLRLRESVQHPALVVDRRLGGIDVLRQRIVFAHLAGAEGDDPAGR